MRPVFITGIGTDVGKTIVAAVVTEALQAVYWKPIQAGFDKGTDALTIASLTDAKTTILPEVYKLSMPASPHIAASAEQIRIDPDTIRQKYLEYKSAKPMVIEGAGGLLVPLNEKDTVASLIQILDAVVIIVSRNYLGSINHSLLTAKECQRLALNTAGWIFTDSYMNYEKDIVNLSDIPAIGSIPYTENINKQFIQNHAAALKDRMNAAINRRQPHH